MSVVKSYFKREFSWRMLFLEHAHAPDFYLSCWQSGRSAVPLLLVRALVTVLAAGIALGSLGIYIANGVGRFWFIYLTHWGVVLNAVAAGFATAVSLRAYLYGPIPSGVELRLPWYVRVYWVLINIAAPISFLITIFYWTLLYDAMEEEYNALLDVSVHALNSATTLLLLAGARHPTRPLHVLQPVAFTLLYTLFNIVFYLAGGVNQDGDRFVYPNIQWSEPGSAALTSLLTAALLALCHALVVGVVLARDGVAAWLVPRPPTPAPGETLPLGR